MAKKPLTPQEFKAIYEKVPRVSVDLVIPHDGGIALTLRSLPSYHNQWHLPGGTAYYKERLTDTVKRIAKEELGLDVVIGELLGYIEYHSEEKERGFGYTISLVFACKQIGGEVQLDEGSSEMRGFTELPDNTVIEQKQFLEGLGLTKLAAKR